MSMIAVQFRSIVLRPTLAALGKVDIRLDSKAAENLLFGTACQESQLGKYLAQYPKGPALGVFQMEPATLNDLLHWLASTEPRRKLLDAALKLSFSGMSVTEQLPGNLYLSAALARINYWRKPFSMPDQSDLSGLSIVWKKWWNTELGAGTTDQWIANYRKFDR